MIIQADSRHIPLLNQSVNCIVTSPPYWSLRKYDIPDLIWDGNEVCEHEWNIEKMKHPMDRNGATGNLGNKRSLDFAQGNIKSGFLFKMFRLKGVMLPQMALRSLRSCRHSLFHTPR